MKTILIASFILFFVHWNMAQISGYVFNLEQQAIPDLTILNKNKNTHTHTDGRGFFRDVISKPGDTLEFSLLGFKPVIYFVKEADLNTPLSIQMENNTIQLDQINITEPLHYNLQLIDNLTRPVQNSQELLRMVPGLFIAQHAGGGKAEQIFLRGFDIDHGTDINLSVDQLLPVNMVSHAHGQGYSDLHFIIPESIKRINYEKGSYNVAKGNFSNAGYADFILQDRLQMNSIIFESGKFDAHRLAGLFKLLNTNHQNAYLAAEYVRTDGYFDEPQNFKRINGLFKYNYKFLNSAELKLTGSHFNSKWNASGQIPQRAVDQGLISRFGAIDSNEGGQTDRSNLMVNFIKPFSANQNLKLSAYYSNYNFELYSNFTFFLKDSINGDQIKQKERRNLIGFEGQYNATWAGIDLNACLGNRLDLVNDIELSHTKDRVKLLDRLAFGSIQENNSYAYLKAAYEWNQLELSVQNRLDLFHFNYTNNLVSSNKENSKTEIKYSPKLTAQYHVNQNLQLFAKTGFGFHSNDSRLLIQDPDISLLPGSFNQDIGFQTKIGSSLFLHVAAWYLFMKDELVYVGDEAIVENSGKTKRQGLEAGLRYQLNKFILFDAESSLTKARTVDDPEGQNYLPLAAKWTHTGGITLKNFHNISTSLRYRILSDRPANEDNSVQAKGYEIMDANIGYNYKNMHFSFIVENIFNQKWNEAQFLTLSRLKDESIAVEEIHFTPGSPTNFRLKVQIDF